MAKKSEAPRRPYCGICKNARQVDGKPFTKTFLNGQKRTYEQRVPCVCMNVAPPAPPQIDAQSRAAGEGS